MIILRITLIVLFYHTTYAEEELFTTCPELKGSAFEQFSNWLSVKQPYEGSKFYFVLKNTIQTDGLLEIDNTILSALKTHNFHMKDTFDSSMKTYVIIHGYRSHVKKPWVLDMKEKILKTENANVILVDWSEGSYNWIIVLGSYTSIQLEQLLRLLFDMKSNMSNFESGSSTWNHLYFIGHSLGAHIAGQTGQLLKIGGDDFFKIARITGLDPARPCFAKADSDIKLDKSDADFVDVIHTQTNQEDKIFGFGLREPIGHLDIYVNGGVMQPACKSNSYFGKELEDMLCSHRMAYNYFLQFMNNTTSCQFEAHPWDQTYDNAMKIFEDVRNKKPCTNCIAVGKDINVKNSGTYLVLTSAEAPYCSLKNDDFSKIEEKLELLKPSEDENLLFDLLFNNRKGKRLS